MICHDVTEDGVADVILNASNADHGGTTDSGVIYVWAGGSSLTGTAQPSATLAPVAASITG